MKVATILVIGFVAVAAIAACAVLEISNHATDVAVILGFTTSILVSLIALVNSSQAKSLLNGTKELAQRNEHRITQVERKVGS